MRYLTAAPLLALPLLVAPMASALEWQTDLPAALAQAGRENKLVLVEFTGSDWCTYCIKLKREVLDSPEFAAYAQASFVPVEIDVPIRKDIGADLLARNKEICKRYKVPGYPTLMVLTPQGQVVGGFRGDPGNGLEGVKRYLNEAQKFARVLATAESRQGVEKARMLHAVYEALQPCMRPCTGLRERIVALDPENVTGIHLELQIEAQRSAFRKALAAAREPQAALALIERSLPESYPQNKAEMLNAKVAVMLATAQTVEDVLAAKAVIMEVCELTPETAEADKAAFEKRFANPQQVLDYVQKHPPMW